MTDTQAADSPPPFRTLSDCVREHALRDPRQPALCDDMQQIDYGQLDACMDRVACALQREGLCPGEAVAICASPSVRYAVAFLGALRVNTGVSDIAHLGGMAFGYAYLRMRFFHIDLDYFRREYNAWKLRRAKKRFQVYLRKHGSDRDTRVN